MANLSVQRRIAAEILKCGEERVWIDPERIEEVAMAATREDIKRLIHEGVIRKKPEQGISRVRANKRHEQKKKGRRRGHGSRKGAKDARCDSKRMWINRIRKIRKFLRMLRDKKAISPSTYRRLYMLAKGGMFRSLRHLKEYIEREGLEGK